MPVDSATTLILIAAAAFLLPLLAARLNLPAVVLEILFGILIGPAGFAVIEHSELLDFLAEFGFFLLMFLSGFEIDFRGLGKQGAARLTAAFAMFGLTLLLAYLASVRLGHGSFITFLLTATSMGLVVSVLLSTRRAQTRLGQAILISAVLADFLTMIGVVVAASIHEHGVGWPLLKIPALFAAIALVLFLLREAVWWMPERFERLFSPHDPEEMGIRTSLALMFVFVGLSLALDIEPILGAFLAGSVFALVFPHRGSLERQLKGFSYGFLIPIFFINVGLHFELRALFEPETLKLAWTLVGLAFLVKVVPSVLLVVFRVSLREAVAGGVLLSPGLSLLIAIAALAARQHLIDPSMQAAVILLAIVTAILCPILFRILAPPLPPPAETGEPSAER